MKKLKRLIIDKNEFDKIEDDITNLEQKLFEIEREINIGDKKFDVSEFIEVDNISIKKNN